MEGSWIRARSAMEVAQMDGAIGVSTVTGRAICVQSTVSIVDPTKGAAERQDHEDAELRNGAYAR